MLENIKCFLLDMDGTFYLGENLLPGALEFMDMLKNRNIEFLFLTNNSSKHASQYVEKLAKFGLRVEKEKILTSGEATILYLKRKNPKAKVFLVGTKALEQEFINGGFRLGSENPDVAVLGFDTTLTYEKIWKLCDLVREGVSYIATHPDINCPTEKGFMPDIGSFIEMIEASTGRLPEIIIGKPFEYMVDAVLARTGFRKSEIAIIGDRLYTDIAMGGAGIATILVLSGETKLKDLENSGIIPDIIVDDLMGVVGMMKEK
jgi:4-nitrophenyl phosphatase